MEDVALDLMTRFAESSGLTSNGPGARYLWTDAFAVQNYLALGRATKRQEYVELAVRLVDRVHHTLGRHRPDDSRTGWISGLEAQEGEAHPTRGGLRIGKTLPERRASDGFDERLEWERDGQYFHYLTQWTHALDVLCRATSEPRYGAWARELADTAFRAFTFTPFGGGARRLFWKMSIDLSRPLVASEGQHDAFDGYVTCVELSDTASRQGWATDVPDLVEPIAEYRRMVEARDLATSDSLGIGGLLIGACRLIRLGRSHDALIARALEAALLGLVHARSERELRLAAERRLAFRELGLAIGLRGVEFLVRSEASVPEGQARASLDGLRDHLGLAERIERFWLEPRHRATATWSSHQDISDVMLATTLIPLEFFGE